MKEDSNMGGVKSIKSTFQLTYLTFTDTEKLLGHACVGITEIKENGSRELLFRVGLFPTNQVEIEDFIKNKSDRVFSERSFDINQEQMIKVLQKINHDRMFEKTPVFKGRPRQPETKDKLPTGESSIPKGPQYRKYAYNCKDYALSLIRAADIASFPAKNYTYAI